MNIFDIPREVGNYNPNDLPGIILDSFLRSLDNDLLSFNGSLALFLVSKVLLKEKKYLILVTILHCLLESEHLVADIVTHLDCLLLVLEFFAAAVLQNHLALLVSTLVFLAPLLVLLDIGEKY